MKYNNSKTIIDGITFDSKKEAKRYTVLKSLEADGYIKDLKLQVPFELLPKGNGERSVRYSKRTVLKLLIVKTSYYLLMMI